MNLTIQCGKLRLVAWHVLRMRSRIETGCTTANDAETIDRLVNQIIAVVDAIDLFTAVDSEKLSQEMKGEM